MPRIDEFLRIMLERGSSDLHMVSGHRPYLRVSGDVTPIEEMAALSSDEIRGIVEEIAPEDNRAQFSADWDTDFAYQNSDLERFRVNCFMDSNGAGSVIRHIPGAIPTFDQLGLPQVLREMCLLTKGLVIVTGPTGCGKSTTLAAMIDLINRTRAEHIVTIEDPIEFMHKPKMCLINQREVHKHTKSFSAALRAALREDPNIVLVGEMRDLETVEIALETAETGHLVFGTLHTNTAVSTIDRIIDKFPSGEQNQIRTMLADTLKGVVAQTLCKRRTGGRVAAMEILVVTSGIASNIRDGKSHQIASSIQTGGALGMCLFEDSLFALVRDGAITTKEAYLKAVRKDLIRKKLLDAGFPLDVGADEIRRNEGSLEEGTSARPEEDMLTECRERLRTDPDNVDSLCDAAWIMSAGGDLSLRKGRDAVKLAERAAKLTGGNDMHVLIVLAAAQAESGNFKRAVGFATQALELAEIAGSDSIAEQLRAHLATYEQNRALGRT
ncbi:MAG: PilT/PilU family type 4a pilus ATPase [Lentisphaerae bacterium]|nr:PilT/PilU family type 4a pilus ATPase [Lentisphaerota bacterium]